VIGREDALPTTLAANTSPPYDPKWQAYPPVMDRLNHKCLDLNIS
jgi:hypothetical protein